MKTHRRWTRLTLPLVAATALAVAGGIALAETEASTASLTVSSTSIKGMAGNKLIVLAKGANTAGRLCVTIPSDDYSLPATTLSEPPVPWDPCGPETPDAALADDSVHLLVMVRIPDTRDDLARSDRKIELSGDTEIVLDGSELSAAAE